MNRLGLRCAVLACFFATSSACAQPTAEQDVDENASTNQSVEDDVSDTPLAKDREGKVLRHAVFFKFKESSSAQQIDAVVEAFKALPNKIPTIQGFEWGVNNSPEGLDDGFTHCFLLTFADEAGRSEYLPHPDHKAFGDVLRPHMEGVFVIDYWGQKNEADGDVLRHAVFFKFKDDADPADVQAVENAFAELPAKIDTIKAFEWGINNSPEHHDHGFTHCFLVTFASEEDRAVYLPHPDHAAFVKVLQPVLDKVRVLDF